MKKVCIMIALASLTFTAKVVLKVIEEEERRVKCRRVTTKSF